MAFSLGPPGFASRPHLSDSFLSTFPVAVPSLGPPKRGHLGVTVGQDSGDYLSVPDVHTLVKGAAGQVLPVGAKGYTVDRFLVLR